MNDPQAKALNALMRHCARVETCSHDARRKLQRYELTAQQETQVMDQLVEEGFVDDSRYARAFAGEKVRIGHQGRLKIRAALKQKGIDDGLIDAALQSIDPEEYAEAIASALAPRLQGLQLPLSWQERGRLLQYAAGRGFEYDETTAYLSEQGIEIE